MIAELVSRVFSTRNAAHIEHWKIKSGYNHETLGDFYEGVIEGIDSIVEAYIGVFGPFEFEPSKFVKGDIVSILESDLIWISENRPQIIRGIRSIDNLVQNLEHTYMTALFKLKTKQ